MGLDISNNRPTPAVFRIWAVPVALLLIGLFILLGDESAREGLRYDRVAIAHGQLWRLVSGHLSHLGWSHFALNGAGLILVWALVGQRYSWPVWLLITAVTLLTIDIGFWFFDPELSWYVGLSGLIHGLLAAGLIARFGFNDPETMILGVLLLVKLAWEQLGGAMPGSEAISGGPVIVAAHLYGTLGGIFAAAWIRIRVQARASI